MTTFSLRTEALPSEADVMVQASRENFPVASLALGRRRQHLLAIYGFARLVDDVGDELHADRGELLDLLEQEIDGIYRGVHPRHPVLVALSATIDACKLPATPFRRLIQANRRDQVFTRYETFEQLLSYCQLSAAPVGELVLHVFGAATPERVALSDRICAALQIIEHLQDVSEDHGRGRLYVPRQDLALFGCTEAELFAPLQSARGRALVAFEAARARALLDEGASLARTLPARARITVAGFVAGGRAALSGVEHASQSGLELSANRRRLSFAIEFVAAAGGRR